MRLVINIDITIEVYAYNVAIQETWEDACAIALTFMDGFVCVPWESYREVWYVHVNIKVQWITRTT